MKMVSTDRKMSLVASFDDLCRNMSVLTEGVEKEFSIFTANQEECRTRWLAAELEIKRLSTVFNKTQAEKAALEGKLKHCRNLLSREMNLRKTVEEERDCLERQILMIKELLLDSSAVNDQTRERLAFLNATTARKQGSPKKLDTIDESTGSLFDPSDIDLTEDDLDKPYVRTRRRRSKRSNGRSSEGKKRPSAPPLPNEDDQSDTPPKRVRSKEISEVFNGNGALVATTTVTAHSGGPTTATSKIESYHAPRTNRSFSEPAPESAEINAVPRLPFRSEGGEDSDDSLWSECVTTPKSVLMTRTPSSVARGCRRYSLGKKSARGHAFCVKTIIKPEKCVACDKRIKFGKMAVKCKDCRTTCHPDCKDRAPTPCTPPVHMASRPLSDCIIADFAPEKPPFVPTLIIYCVEEVEKRGLTETGIYRVPGSEREVKDLKEKFLRGKGIPNLTKIDIYVVCGCIKDFLRSLKEPLITYSLWKDFVKASEIHSERQSELAVKNAVHSLPPANRDTLAFLIVHLQLVANSPVCKMPVENLARVFGPTVVGYSSPDPVGASMLSETKQQANVMQRLLTMPLQYWTELIDITDDDINGGFPTPQTPETRPVPQPSMLGPLTPSSSRSSLTHRARAFLTHTPLGPRGLHSRKKNGIACTARPDLAECSLGMLERTEEGFDSGVQLLLKGNCYLSALYSDCEEAEKVDGSDSVELLRTSRSAYCELTKGDEMRTLLAYSGLEL